MSNCNSCRYKLVHEIPYLRCLMFYGQGAAVNKIKDGLIGQCREYKNVEPNEQL